MDTLTHGLFGLAVGALRRPDVAPGAAPASATDRAVLVAAAVAAELPDLDYLWPAGDAVLRNLRAHRGPSHSLLAAPLVAAIAVAIVLVIARLCRWRDVRLGPTFAFAWLSVVLAHLLPDLWTGWGTRLFLPLSDARHALDWTMVIDPLVTLPLLAGALVALVRRRWWRRALVAGAAVAGLYVGARAAGHEVLEARLRAAYPAAERVDVFPALLRPLTWRYVVVDEAEYVAGSIGLTGAPRPKASHPRPAPDVLPHAIRRAPAVAEALAWARHPVVALERGSTGHAVLRIADLRYHFGGQPTLTFVFTIDAGGQVTGARLDRGGSGRELLRRWREDG